MSESPANAYEAPIVAGDCQRCGAELPDIARFCLQCGAARAGTPTWKTTAFIVVVMIQLLLILGAQVFVVPSFLQMYKDFGGELPLPTQFVVDGAWVRVSFVAVAAPAVTAWRLRPGSTIRTVAAWGTISIGFLVLAAGLYALYAPIFAIAGAIK